MYAYKCQWRKRSSEVSGFANGVTKQSLTDAIIAHSATDVYSKWTTIVRG